MDHYASQRPVSSQQNPSNSVASQDVTQPPAFKPQEDTRPASPNQRNSRTGSSALPPRPITQRNNAAVTHPSPAGFPRSESGACSSPTQSGVRTLPTSQARRTDIPSHNSYAPGSNSAYYPSQRPTQSTGSQRFNPAASRSPQRQPQTNSMNPYPPIHPSATVQNTVYSGQTAAPHPYAQTYADPSASYGQAYSPNTYGNNSAYSYENSYADNNTLAGDPYDDMKTSSWTRWIPTILSGVVFLVCVVLLITLLL